MHEVRDLQNLAHQLRLGRHAADMALRGQDLGQHQEE
jgi:hypothetical protein